MTEKEPQLTPVVRELGLCDYRQTWHQMRDFTLKRTVTTPDEIWLLQHLPVFTQGQAGKSEHILHPGTIPIVQTDRGGQVTYHGPGQLIGYFLIDLKRRNWGIKKFVSLLENLIIDLLNHYQISGHTIPNSPGVYVNNAKICSIGLKVCRGCTYHGIALNAKMDLEPFSRINPCGYHDLTMTQMDVTVSEIIVFFCRIINNIFTNNI